jgi:hypothetical protein
VEEELNVQHSTFNFQRRIEEIKKSEEKEKKESIANNGESPSPDDIHQTLPPTGLRPSPAAIIVMTPAGSGEIKLCGRLLSLQVLKIIVDFFIRLFYNPCYGYLV